MTFTQELEKAGFTREQAEAAINMVHQFTDQNLATKTDILEPKDSIEASDPCRWLAFGLQNVRKMRRSLDRIFLIAVSVALSGTSLSICASASELKNPKRITRAAFCDALLVAGASVPFVDPKASLRELKSWVADQTKNPKDLPLEEGYGPNSQVINFDRKPRAFYPTRAAARLELLDRDTSNYSPGHNFAAFEFRGAEAVTQVRDLMVSHLNQLNPAVIEELKKRYPPWRASEIVRHAMAAFQFLAPLSVYAAEDPLLKAVALAIIPFAWMTAGIAEFFLPMIKAEAHSIDFGKQLKIIDNVLTGQFTGSPAHLVGLNLTLPTEVHNLIFNTDDELLPFNQFKDKIADASEGARAGLGDHTCISRRFQAATAGMSAREKLEYLVNIAANEAKNNPEGSIRHVQFDSLFYVDPKTREPVWLLYYRSFKEAPLPPKKPKTASEPKRQWQLEPGLLPVDVR